ncbi:Trihelix transcription factor GTL2 [Sesamum alatum]|uniref:Trihelix transcription factor GTL2 n=1 Tax=Sesamum alatum TaxID=300844 RepID=A0AAE2C9T5_9LAMI|nr:Trihelix transcription factor GTL2 [Sesamum alatum]
MFDGVPSDQFHQFLASSRTSSSLPINPLSFPLHRNPPSFAASYDHPYASSLHSQAQLHQQLQESAHKKFIDVGRKHNNVDNPAALISTLERERSRSMDPAWSNDEVLALLRLRSGMEMWFPDFTWEHVSRKLVELGFRRSAEQCKEKFDEESRNLNSVSYKKNYRIFSELDELYPAADDQETARVSAERISQNMEINHENEDNQDKVINKNAEDNSENVGEAAAVAADPSQQSEEAVRKPEKSSKKRKRREKFEMFKGFCESVVNKMMARQEELHNKLIEDIVKRDEEKICREEAWKNQEMDRIKMEIEMRAKEQASAGERQATIIQFLKKFSSDEDHQHLANKIQDLVNMKSNSSTSLGKILETHHSQTAQNKAEPSNSSTMIPAHQNPSSFPAEDHNPTASKTKTPSPSSPATKDSKSRTSTSAVTSTIHYERGSGDSAGKRWPRDEIQALINLRCKLSSSSNSSDESNKVEGGANYKAPLWERISQGMSELGYKRSAKRCKEKWENINKYFRKTKDSNKKRSIDSRTCPYFHQLSCLYSEGTLVAPTTVPETHHQYSCREKDSQQTSA